MMKASADMWRHFQAELFVEVLLVGEYLKAGVA